MSKLSSARLRVKKIILIQRLPPLVTLVLSPIAFILAILALTSEGTNSLRGSYVIALNTTNLLKDVLKITPVPSATIAARAIDPMITSPPTMVNARQFFPPPEQVGSFFKSVGSGLSSAASGIESKVSTAINPAGTGTLGGLLNGGGDDSLGDLFGKNGPLSTLFGNGTLSNLFNKPGSFTELFDSLGGQAASLLVKLVNKLAEAAVDGLGLADQYALYMRVYCSANVTAGTQQLGSRECSALRQISIAKPSNSTIQVGNMMIDYSALNILNKLSGTGGIIKVLSDAIFAFQVIGITGSGLVFFLAIMLVFISSPARKRRLLAGLISTVATVFLLVVSLIEILIAIAVPLVVNPLGQGLGIEAKTSTNFVAFIVVSSLFMGIISLVWIVHNLWTWHDEKYIARSPVGLGSEKRNTLVSGRPILKLSSSDDDRIEERMEETSNIPAALRLSQFGNIQSTIGISRPRSLLPAEMVHTPPR